MHTHVLTLKPPRCKSQDVAANQEPSYKKYKCKNCTNPKGLEVTSPKCLEVTSPGLSLQGGPHAGGPKTLGDFFVYGHPETQREAGYK
jgi:hypothetical protein